MCLLVGVACLILCWQSLNKMGAGEGVWGEGSGGGGVRFSLFHVFASWYGMFACEGVVCGYVVWVWCV